MAQTAMSDVKVLVIHSTLPTAATPSSRLGKLETRASIATFSP
jgi:hypothetical protein